MPEFGLRFNRKEFEYDVYSLIKAFYPAASVRIVYDPEKSDPEWDAEFSVCYREEKTIFACRMRGEEKGRTEKPRKAAGRADYKNEVKQLVYDQLSVLTGKTLPWGDLTGIRPTKLPMRMLEEGKSRDAILNYMRETYRLSSEKALLAVNIAETEKRILDGMDPQNGYSLYIGIPFCPSICLYCSFGSHPLEKWKNRTDEYLRALEWELCCIADEMRGRELHTIYVGGGTPTSLSAKQLEDLLAGVEKYFPADTVREFTVECGRPDTITAEKLQVLKRFPVSRISVNPQTMNRKTLERIGRNHTPEEIIRAFYMAREQGFSNINMDLIVGLPGEGEAEVSHTLEEIAKLAPDSLTVHSLALKRATRLNLYKDEYAEDAFVNSAAIMRQAEECARALAMRPYYLYRQKNIAGNFENVGYAKEGKEGLYNILIMEEKESILAAGAGASTKFVFDGGKRIERAENVKDLTHYLERLPEMLERKRAGIAEYLR